jgi:hypothetical protein
MNRAARARRLRTLQGLGTLQQNAAYIDQLVQGAAVDTNVGRPIWIDPPSNWEVVDQATYITLPAVGVTSTILSFTVPPGRNGVIQKIANNLVGGGFTEGSGDVIWRILVDNAPPPGATSYNSIVNSLGNPASPTSIPGFRIYENQVVSIVVQNVAVVPAGQFVGGRLVGYIYPRELEDGNTWL